jgi:plasmid stabilization system protein ParE
VNLGYRLSRRASREFDAIVDYRRRVAGDASARRLEADLIDAFGLIASQPGMGSRRPDLTMRRYRFWLKHDYWIIYRLHSAQQLLIVALIDARRDIGRLLRQSGAPA